MHVSTAKSKHAFTLIELLVVIAIIAILSVVVVLTLNPAGLLQQSRDANRVSDMSTLNSAISVYLSAGGLSLGNTNTVYVSIPDPTATSTAGDQCQGLGLPTLPSTYSYHCAATSTVKNVDSTGWIPINFGTVAIGSSLSQLPIDPINTSSTRNYYTYTTNGTQFEVTAPMESAKYKLGGSNDVVSGDGSTLSTVYAKGSNLSLEPLDYGDASLVGLWSFNEGTGTVAYDYSGSNATGTWNGTQTGSSGYYSAGKIGPWAGAFDGSNNYVGTHLDLGGQSVMSVGAWINLANTSTQFIANQWGGSTQAWLLGVGVATGNVSFFSQGGNVSVVQPSVNTWHFIVGVYNGSTVSLYVDGVLAASAASTGGTIVNGASLTKIGARAIDNQCLVSGLIDDVRIYNRALSASEIAAMYSGGK